jgi:hypothetical protein
MKLSKISMKRYHCLMTLLLVALRASPCMAISLSILDDFQDGSVHDWEGFLPQNVADAGPSGAGDAAMMITSNGFSSVGGKLITYDRSQWTGNWTSVGVAQVALDVRNPNPFPLMMRAALAGPDGFIGGGSGDTYSTTQAVAVPADNAWHSIVIDVLPDDFTFVGGEPNVPDITAALADVTQFRILHNNFPSFLGEQIEASFFLDNIRPLAAGLALDGDYHGNGVVDAADYTVWRDMLGQTGADLPADGTGPGGIPDGIVDQLDYNFWKVNFGAASTTGSASAPEAVPEPATWLLIFSGCHFFRHRRRLE